MSFDNVVEGVVGVIFLIIALPIFIALLNAINTELPTEPPEPVVLVNETLIEEAQNLSQQLELCQKNLEELNSSIVTKTDLQDVMSAIAQINQNVINIYETNNQFISARITLTITLSITLTLVLSLGLLTLLDVTVFKAELSKALWRVIKKRFSKEKL